MNAVRVLRVMVVVCVVTTLFPTEDFLWAAGGDMGAGTEPLTDGSEAYPWLIEDFADFQVFANVANAAIYWAAGVHTRLMCDLDLDPVLPGRVIYTTAVIAPFMTISFAGHLDGDGHNISNLTVNNVQSCLGLFGSINNGAVNRLGLVNINICCSAPSSGKEYPYHGGLCGINNGLISNCFVTGSVVGEGNSIFIGGFCGRNYGQIENCFSTTCVIGLYALGGLCGSNDGVIINCYAKGSVTGAGNSRCFGGLCGRNNGYHAIITNCYATGYIAEGVNSADFGGFCGYQQDGQMGNCFWDMDTSLKTVGYNLDDFSPGIINNVVGKTTFEMQLPDTFLMAGWDFVGDDGDPADWKMRAKPYYPILNWQRDVYGDVAFDGVVNLADVALMAGQWMLTAADGGYLERCDLLDDDVIDGGDLAVLAGYWLYPEITGDFDDESGVNLADFAMLSSAWQAVPSDPSYLPVCNLNDSGASEGIIDLADLAIFCEHWLEN
ncbi:MAG: hypothetical protein JW709_02670 [Sedimentisphaerales bacterium]|nr:hypothetical protein [Sedimentisphaerales bacterium]